MDIRILTLFLLITIVGSFADLRSPFFGIHRNGLQESGKSHAELAGMPRAIRETTAESTDKSTATPKRTADPPARGTNPMRTTKKPDSEPSPEPDSNPTTSSTPDSSSTSEPNPTTGSMSKPAAKPAAKPPAKPAAKPAPKPAAKPKSTTPRPKVATTAKPRTTTAATRTPRPATAARRTPRPTQASATTPRPTPASARTSRPATAAANRTPRPSASARRTPKPTDASARTPRPATEATASSTRAPRPVAATRAARPSTTAATTPKPTTTPTTTTKPSDSGNPKTESPDASAVIGSRFNPFEENPQEDLEKDPQQSLQPKFETGPQDSRKKAQEPSASEPNTQMGPRGGSPSGPGFQNFPIPQFPFMPSFIPNFSPYNPYSDPLFNSIPGPNNNAWTGSNSGSGMASSFAGASAGSFAGASGGSSAGSGYGNPPVSDRGSFVDSGTNAGNTPTADYMPNPFSWGYNNNAGDPAFDQSSFVFPGYNPENFQRQMEENFRQLQAQLQQQQQSLFDTANRIGTDGYSGPPGAHSAVSSINLGPGGGHQAGAINPAAPGVVSRFAEDLPAPSGNSYGVFAGSSSRTVVGPDGKPVSHKISTTGVNDNGKITFHTVQD